MNKFKKRKNYHRRDQIENKSSSSKCSAKNKSRLPEYSNFRFISSRHHYHFYIIVPRSSFLNSKNIKFNFKVKQHTSEAYKDHDSHAQKLFIFVSNAFKLIFDSFSLHARLLFRWRQVNRVPKDSSLGFLFLSFFVNDR